MAALGLEESEEEKRLRAAACLLADIGWRAHPDYRGEQSLNIITNAAFVGIDHPGRAYLALAIYYRHAGLTEEELGAGLRELAPLRYRESARALAGALPGGVSRFRRGGGRAAPHEGAGGRAEASSWCFRPSSPTSVERDSKVASASSPRSAAVVGSRHGRASSYSAALARRPVEPDRHDPARATWKAQGRRASARAPARRRAFGASRAAQARRRGRRRNLLEVLGARNDARRDALLLGHHLEEHLQELRRGARVLRRRPLARQTGQGALRPFVNLGSRRPESPRAVLERSKPRGMVRSRPSASASRGCCSAIS